MQNSHRHSEESADHHKGAKSISRTTMSNLGKTRTSTSIKVDRSKDKELINNGLHKLLTSFTTANKINSKPSKLLRPNHSKVLTETSNLEGQSHSQIVLTKQISSDKYTMTDFRIKPEERKLNLERVLGDSQLSSPQGRDLQWTDPRLLKKYNLVNQPCKKALTVPYVDKTEQNTEIMDELSSVETAEMIYAEDKHIFVRCLYHIGTTSVSFIGSMCGIILITLIFWKVLDESIFTYFQLLAPRPEIFIRGPITSLVWSLICALNTVFGKFMRVLTMSTNEVFMTEEENYWYKNYITY